jgi:hypothetical protein
MVVSGLITILMLAVGAGAAQSATPDCNGMGFGECLGQIFGNALGEFIGVVIFTAVTFLLLVLAAWFLTGMLAGWQVVRHIRRLEPGITSRQGWGVSSSWGCGAIVAALVMIVLLVIFSNALGL